MARPPTFLVFGTQADPIPEGYSRYSENGSWKTFDLPETPIRLRPRGTKYPFVEKGKWGDGVWSNLMVTKSDVMSKACALPDTPRRSS